MKAVQWLKGLSITKKVLLGVGTLIVLSAASHGNQPATTINTTNTTAKTHAPVIVTKTVTETQSIPFATTTIESSSLAKGKSEVTTQGVNGSKTLTYSVTYTDNKETGRKLVNTRVDKEPVTQVTTLGTYEAPSAPSCPNGTYVNSAGNTVCSPYSSTSAPAGATARCVDGTYSFSQSHSGTCSHHGGVATWL